MRKILIVVLFFVIGILLLNTKALAELAYISICDHPISYRIGEIDSEFNITREELMDRAQEAVNTWRKAASRTLFIYDPDGLLVINMDFDGRQTLANEISDLEQELENKKNSIDPQEQEYNRRAKEFKERIAKLNEDIQYWNSRGGAPEEEYKKLIAEQDSLRQEGEALNQMAASLNRSTELYNTDVGELNKTVRDFNSAIEVRPEEGLYSSGDNTITLFLNRGHNASVHTLTHEFGHALGMDHVENPDAIMYSQTNDVIEPTTDDVAELNKACREQFFGSILNQRFAQLVQRVKQNLIKQ